MSDLCIDERDYNVFDKFHGNDDGIVPDSVYKDDSQFPVIGSSKKKQRHEDMDSRTNHLKSNIFIKREGDMLGRNPWPEKNSGGSPASCDAGSGKDVQDMTLKDTKISDHGFNGGHVDVVANFGTTDPMLCDNAAATHDGVYNYSLNNISDAENNLSFLDNGDKDSNDLFYGWGDLGNFEDVDDMLRSCDSTFGLDSLNNEDDLCWFSSAQPNEDSDDIKPDIMLNNQRSPMLQVEDFLNKTEFNHAVEDEYGYTVVGGSAQGKLSENVSGTSSQKKDILMLDGEANLEKKQTDHLHSLDGKSDGYSENSFTLQHSGISMQIMGTAQYCPPSAFQQAGLPACESKSGIKYENKPNPLSASDESYTSNQAQSVESLQGTTVDDRCGKGFEKRDNLQSRQDMRASLAASTRKSSKGNPIVLPDSAPIQKTRIENDHRKASELGTSNRQESSFVSSVVDDISLEATSFRHLQQVIEQLDVRTKLCIRDSLYRLAKSADQRHNCMNPNVGNRQEKGAGSHLETGGADKYVGFMDMETDTNPIDRSIAHLLFHRPSDSSFSSDNDALSYKPHPVIPEPNSSSSLRIEKQEETPELRTETEIVASENK